MSRNTRNAAAATSSAVHATHMTAGVVRDPSTGALTLSPGGGEPAPHPRVMPSLTGSPPPAHVGGGIGWEIEAERRALTELGDVLAAEAGTRPVRLALHVGLMGPWPWLHIGRRDNPRMALGVVRVTGQAWAYLAAPVPAAQSGPMVLGALDLEAEPLDRAPLARAILAGLFGGTWPATAAAATAAAVAALVALATQVPG